MDLIDDLCCFDLVCERAGVGLLRGHVLENAPVVNYDSNLSRRRREGAFS